MTNPPTDTTSYRGIPLEQLVRFVERADGEIEVQPQEATPPWLEARAVEAMRARFGWQGDMDVERVRIVLAAVRGLL